MVDCPGCEDCTPARIEGAGTETQNEHHGNVGSPPTTVTRPSVSRAEYLKAMLYAARCVEDEPFHLIRRYVEQLEGAGAITGGAKRETGQSSATDPPPVTRAEYERKVWNLQVLAAAGCTTEEQEQRVTAMGNEIYRYVLNVLNAAVTKYEMDHGMNKEDVYATFEHPQP
jgi:hypothetical protein